VKNYIIALVTVIALTPEVYSQTDQDQIVDIDKTRKEIVKNIDSYRQTENNKDSVSYRYVYREGNDLKLIMIEYKDRRYGGKYIDKKVEWYFSKGHLIYSEQTWTDIPSGKLVDNEKCYLNDQHLIAWIKFENKTVDKTSREFIDADTQLVAYGVKLQKEAK
jgi:hypothetical protein